VGNFNTAFSPIGRLSRQKKMNNASSELNNTVDQIDLTDIYRRIFHQTATEYTSFSAAHTIFSKYIIF
jgi:hypothetical protein